MINEICSDKLCTACGGCENVCPKSCVQRDKKDASFLMTKGIECIECGLCEKTCPILSIPDLNYPMKAYAAWSTDPEVRRKSASGGVATSLYSYSVANGNLFVGAYLDEEFICHLKIGLSNEDIAKFQNSKYTYSYPDDIYREVGHKIKSGDQILFIGLPCQVAALKNYFKVLKINSEKLLTIDLVCHGTPNPDYLVSHIKAVTKKYRHTATQCYFRDNNYRTQEFIFSLYDENDEQLYKRGVTTDDLYQIGYHKALIYRDSCYSCPFAQASRTGDLTIGDYHVKDVDECDIEIENVSLILVNNEKGMSYLKSCEKSGYLHIIERQIEEPLQGEKQLRHPSIAGAERNRFLREYQNSKNFEHAAYSAFRSIVISRRLKVDNIKYRIKKAIKQLVPRKIWKSLKSKLKSDNQLTRGKK